TFSAPQFVVAKVQGDSPQPGGKFAARLVILPLNEHASKSFLCKVLAVVRVAGHAQAKSLNRALPAADQLGKCALVILGLDAPHGLLVGDGKERAKRGKGSGPHTTIPVRAREKYG